MITKEQAMTVRMFYHVTQKNADGTPIRCRANGQCKTWKSRPFDFRLPVKHGLRDCFYLTPSNADQWTINEDDVIVKDKDSYLEGMCQREKAFRLALDANHQTMRDWTLRLIYADWLDDNDRPDDAATQRWMANNKRRPVPDTRTYELKTDRSIGRESNQTSYDWYGKLFEGEYTGECYLEKNQLAYIMRTFHIISPITRPCFEAESPVHAEQVLKAALKHFNLI